MNEKAILDILIVRTKRLRSRLDDLLNLTTLTCNEGYKIKVQIEPHYDSPMRYLDDKTGEGISLLMGVADNNAREDYMKKNGKPPLDTHFYQYSLSFEDGFEIILESNEIEKIKRRERLYQTNSIG